MALEVCRSTQRAAGQLALRFDKGLTVGLQANRRHTCMKRRVF